MVLSQPARQDNRYIGEDDFFVSGIQFTISGYLEISQHKLYLSIYAWTEIPKPQGLKILLADLHDLQFSFDPVHGVEYIWTIFGWEGVWVAPCTTALTAAFLIFSTGGRLLLPNFPEPNIPSSRQRGRRQSNHHDHCWFDSRDNVFHPRQS